MLWGISAPHQLCRRSLSLRVMSRGECDLPFKTTGSEIASHNVVYPIRPQEDTARGQKHWCRKSLWEKPVNIQFGGRADVNFSFPDLGHREFHRIPYLVAG